MTKIRFSFQNIYPHHHIRTTFTLQTLGAYGVVVSMFDFHRSDRGSNPGRGGKIS